MSRLDALTEYAATHYLSRLEQEQGQQGVELAKRLHPHLRRIYAAVDYASIQGSMTVVAGSDLAVAAALNTQPVRVRSTRELALVNTGTMTIQVVDGDNLLVWHEALPVAELRQVDFVYTYSVEHGERFWINGTAAGEEHPRGYPLFGLPLFRGLEEALQRYGQSVARYSQCDTLLACWREPARVMWGPAPEAGMRRSLCLFLRHTLVDGTADVQEEAPADDRNPVDITVRWADSNRIALIEVKWLGKSGALDPPRVTGYWPESRARNALQQLSDYLDLTRERSGHFDLRGYLAVFDGRRAKVRPETQTVTREDGLSYRDADITYDEALLARHDIAEPLRFFCEPMWVHSAPSKRSK